MTTNAATEHGLQVVHGARAEPSEAIGLLANAQRVADETVANARADAERMLATARHNAQMLEQQAREQAERHLNEAGQEAERVRYQGYGQAERMLGDARGQVAELERSAARLRSERDAAAEAARELAAKLVAAVDQQGPDAHGDHGHGGQ
jgi:cell division septum initiation protein DivIVA